MAQASFFKDMPLANNAQQDGADFRPTTNPKFQMVPANGSRKWRVNVTAGPVRVASADETRAGVALTASGPTVKFLQFNASGDFFILGGKAKASTFIVVEDDKGVRLDFIQVLVTTPKLVSFNLVRLKDAVTDTSMSLSRAVDALAFVKTLFANATNTIMSQQKATELQIQRNLSDSAGVLQLDKGVFDNKESIIFDAVMASGMGSGVDLVYILTWQIEGRRNIAQPTGLALDGRAELAKIRSGPTLLYINSFGLGNTAFTMAHETGHHFKLGHAGHVPPFLMDGGVIGGFRLTQDDIVTVNPRV